MAAPRRGSAGTDQRNAPRSVGQATPASGFIKGADISFLQEIENRGGVFTEDGTRKDVLKILTDHGVNSVRLRIWHTPPGDYCGLDSTLLMASRVKAAGLPFLLNFHYSDTWADPGKQAKPQAWVGLDSGSLKDSVYEYTRRVMTALKDQNTLPDMVQIGNEITCGMLWDDGRICGSFDTPGQWAKLGDLIAAAVDGVDAALLPADSTRIMIHIDRGGDVDGATRFFDNLVSQGIWFDVIGLSYYPWWHGTLTDLETTLSSLSCRYDRDIIVVETAYPWSLDWHDDVHNIVGLKEHLHKGYPATVGGQEAFLLDLMAVVARTPASRGRGVFYWAPEYISVPGLGSAWENVTLFDLNGEILPSVAAFDSAVTAGPSNESDGEKGDLR
jgi:arabinogalactan endo-1,4-beta-galactosidase